MDVSSPVVKRIFRPLPLEAISRLYRGNGTAPSPSISSPILQQIGEQICSTDWAASIYDSSWRLQWCSPELQTILGTDDPEELGYGKHALKAHQLPRWRKAVNVASWENEIQEQLPILAADAPGGMEELLKMIPPKLAKQLRGLEPRPPEPVQVRGLEYTQSGMPPLRVWSVEQRITDEQGFHGTLRIYGPSLKASILSYVARGDDAMFERLLRLYEPGPRRCAVLFADIEASTKLSRKLNNQAFFSLLAEFSRGVDEIVSEECGIVSSRAGDGVVAFFVGDEFDDPSATVTATLRAAEKIQKLTAKLEKQTNVQLPTAIRLRVNIGMHWGETLYIGQLIRGGRLEVSALGDEVNACSRIEASAKGGQILASKQLMERLNPEDAASLKVQPGQLVYEPLGELPAGDVSRDTRELPVTELKLGRSTHSATKPKREKTKTAKAV